jgi:hypothetical protein
MEPLIIAPTRTSLEVKLDPQTGQFSFSGRARPENSQAFFGPIAQWLRNYAKQPAPSTECSFRLEYFNSSARKSMMEILGILDGIHHDGKKVTVTWYYDANDDGMRETGEEYKDLFRFGFILKQNPA